MSKISDYISLERRYMRSVNLERDLDRQDAISGYVLTSRAVEALERFARAISVEQVNRAFTVTGVYGTGKSSAAHFFTSLVAPDGSPVRDAALSILNNAGIDLPDTFVRGLPKEGYIRAVATGRREPLENTIVRGLVNGVSSFWSTDSKPKAARNVLAWNDRIEAGETPSAIEVVNLVKEVATASGTGVVLLLDELGKNLEFVVQNPGKSDVYLMQQIAELPTGRDDPSVLLIGVLHQSFTEYGQSLATIERKEWGKIQGRFEDIAFSESPEQMLRLIGAAITTKDELKNQIDQDAIAWSTALRVNTGIEVSADILAEVLPLHPLTALVLPILTTRFAQNDRSLFSFLTSEEPLSFASYTTSTAWQPGEPVPLLGLDLLYKYFEESLGQAAGGYQHSDRWTEVQGLVAENLHRKEQDLTVLRTIGLLNMVGSNTQLRATESLVRAGLMNVVPVSDKLKSSAALKRLKDDGVLSYRKQADEYRLWRGTDFDVDAVVSDLMQQDYGSLAQILSEVHPLNHRLAQRHSFATGTLRWYQQHYVDREERLATLAVDNEQNDAHLVLWVGDAVPKKFPAFDQHERPIAVLVPENASALNVAAREYLALLRIPKDYAELQTDGVARKEVAERTAHARNVLQGMLESTFQLQNAVTAVVAGQKIKNVGHRKFAELLSTVLDEAYDKQLILFNELLNRRKLSTQAAKGRRLLVERILDVDENVEPNLGITGRGPEYSMLMSLLSECGFLCNGSTGIQLPTSRHIVELWNAMDSWIAEQSSEISIQGLYEYLMRPPFGVKEGPIPVLVALFVKLNASRISLYKDGTFIPIVAAEHFELMVKKPSRFAIRVFEHDERALAIFKIVGPHLGVMDTNHTQLAPIKLASPLIKFVTSRSKYAQKTRTVSARARSILDDVLSATDPARLIFESIPQSLGIGGLSKSMDPESYAKKYSDSLIQIINEINGSYDAMLERVGAEVALEFECSSDLDNMHKELRARASKLLKATSDPKMTGLIHVLSSDYDPKAWFEKVLLVIADISPDLWSDTDLAQFGIQLRLKANVFKDLESVSGQKSADVRLLSYTDAMGETVRSVFSLNSGDREEAKETAISLVEEHAEKGTPFLKSLVLEMIDKIGSLESTMRDSNDARSADDNNDSSTVH